jgi:hypothetical protein
MVVINCHCDVGAKIYKAVWLPQGQGIQVNQLVILFCLALQFDYGKHNKTGCGRVNATKMLLEGVLLRSRWLRDNLFEPFCL